MIGLSLNTAAYTSETLRAAISSIDKGQWEAAASIGMTPWQTLRRAILPRPARSVTAVEQQLYQPGKRYVAGGHHSGAGAFPSGAADHLADAGSVHDVSGGLADLLGDGDGAFRPAELF